LFLLHRPYAEAAANPRNLRPALAAGGVLPRRETVLGFEDPQNRVSKATQRTAPLVFYIYDLVLLWHATSGHLCAPQSALERLWYKRKTSVSFEDILRNLRQAHGKKRFSATPDSMHKREKSFSPLSNGPKLLHKCAKR
jgi:hypothetical protein